MPSEAKVMERTGEIWEQLKELEGSIASLEVQVETLGSRLTPICHAPEEKQMERAAPPVDTIIGRDLALYVNRIRNCNDKLITLIKGTQI